GGAQAAHGLPGDQGGEGGLGVGGFLQPLVDPGGHGGAGADAVDADAVLHVVDGHRAGEADDGVLGGGVGAPVEDAAQAGGGGGVDDDALLAGEEDLREGFLGQEEGAFHVDAEDVVELLLGGGDGGAGDADAGVVAEDVEAAEE